MLVPHAKPAVSYNDLFGTFCKDYLNKYIRQNYYWTGSGSAAIYLAIKATRAKKVAVPAFTCSIVKDAIKKSGAKCQFYDTGIVATLADVRKALAKKPDLLILAYNFGLIPDNLNEILKLCKKQKVPVLEDCAQAFSFGQNAQFTIYSTGIAKSLSYYGGFLVSKKQLDIEKLNSLSVKQEFLFFVKATPIFISQSSAFSLLLTTNSVIASLHNPAPAIFVSLMCDDIGSLDDIAAEMPPCAQ